MFKTKKKVFSNAVTAGGVQSSSFAKACPRHCQHHPGNMYKITCEMDTEAVKSLKRVERAKEHSSISTSEGMIKEPDTFYVNEV
jgi:hypothetical protein